MRHDTILRGLSPLLIGLLIAVAAYLQAVGLAQVMDSVLGGRSRLPPSRLAAAGPAATPPREKAVDATPILARNPFDSVTGSLRERAAEASGFGRAVLRDTRPCDDVRPLIIAASSDGWSFVMLEGPDGTRQLRREGDLFGDRAVTGIGWDRVWLARAGERCEARLGAPPLSVEPRAPRAPPSLADHDRGGLRRVGPGRYEIERRVVDGFLRNPEDAFGRVRVVPDAGGVRLSNIRAGTWPARLGLQNGDRIASINGMPLATPEEALVAYARLRSADDLEVIIVRGGQRQQLAYRVR